MNTVNLLPSLEPTLQKLTREFDQIHAERKRILQQLTDFIAVKVNSGKTANLNFICTHNSRRSHISQIWAATAAYYYGVPNVTCFSGGTEATAFNHRSVKAMQEAGFSIHILEEGENPVYEVRYAENEKTIRAFSKKYDDPTNPINDFAAIMTCSHADANCPFIPGAVSRIALTYDDPKDFDGTPLEAVKYTERVHEIGREILFAFSRVNA